MNTSTGVTAAVLLGFGALPGCQTHHQARNGDDPIVDARTCSVTLDFSPPFPPDPQCHPRCTRTRRRARCAASPVLGNLVVEKTFGVLEIEEPGGGWRDEKVIEWWLLRAAGGKWDRILLGSAQCSGETTQLCSYDELFRRSFELAADGDLAAALGRPVASYPIYNVGKEREIRTDHFVTAWKVVLGATPHVIWVPAVATAEQLLHAEGP